MPFGYGAKFCREWARVSLWSFYKDVKVENYDELDLNQPIIFACTHHNMLVDPAVINYACSKGYLHYWAKSEIFVNNYANQFLNSVGCVPVDRTSKDHQKLYQSTFDVLELNESIAIFPEGTSHTLPYLGKLREGASFIALEYAKSLQDKPRLNKYDSPPKPAVIVPVGITYTDKSKYRSSVIVKFGEPINVLPYLSEFTKNPKLTAKQVTKQIEDALLKVTINAPNWEIRYSALMARDMLLSDMMANDHKVLSSNFIPITQEFINSMFHHYNNQSSRYLVSSLNMYKQEIDALSLRDVDLNGYDYDSKTLSLSIGKRFTIESFFMILDLLMYLPVILAHLPLYLVSSYIANQEIYEEVRAQDKIIYATLALPFVYFGVWLWLWYYLYPYFTLSSFVLSLTTLIVLFWLHVVTIDERYERFKKWRGSFHLFDAFVLHRGNGRLKKRILNTFKLKNAIEQDLKLNYHF